MPVSLATAAQNWNTEKFLAWNPALNAFSSTIYGRKRRIDPFVSLWHRSSRRSAIFITPGQDLTGVSVVKHTPSDTVYLISPTVEVDDYEGAGNYSRMVRCQKAMAPFGGAAEYYPVTVSGTGDNLGAVTVGPVQNVYVDIELRTTEEPEGVIREQVGDYLIFCSSNVSPLDGDFVKLAGKWYQSQEWYSESGFLCCRARQTDPAYVTATFYLVDSTAPVYDPVTGTFSSTTQTQRAVSVQVAEQGVTGRTTDKATERMLTCNVSLRHIGFTPQIGQKVAVSGVAYRVTRLAKGVEGLQWELELTP